MSEVINIYQEFVDDNMYKRYPMIEDTGTPESGVPIPDSFMVDTHITVCTTDRALEDSYKFSVYISKVTVYTDYVYVYFSDIKTSSLIAKSEAIPITLTEKDSISDRTISIMPTGNIAINGSLIVGTCRDIKKLQGVHNYEPEYGMLFPGCVSVSPDYVSGIQVGDQIATGLVTLKAGKNIDIQYDADSNTIEISIKRDNDDNTITNDAELIDYIKSTYGNPIISINGIQPDNKGNITIEPTDCFMVLTDPTNSSITFYNPCAPACASYDFLDDTLDRIKDLNGNVAVLKSFYDSVSNTLAQMGVRISAVIESKKGTAK